MVDEERKKILVVDDERDIRELVSMRLRGNGYEVMLARGGIDALEILKEDIPDLVLLDIVMPDMDGIEVCRRMKKIKYMAAVPVIFFSARASLQDKIAGLKEGVHDYITKPFDAQELLARIDAVIRLAEHNKKILLRDELTGLYNYNFFKEEFYNYFNIARRYGRTFSLLISDIDNFKKINDRYGHMCGNVVLEAVANKFKAALRNADVITRYGGDEFAIILPETDVLKVEAVLRRLRSELEGFEIVYKDQSIAVSISMGASTYSAAVHSTEDLFNIADKNMYEDKKGVGAA